MRVTEKKKETIKKTISSPIGEEKPQKGGGGGGKSPGSRFWGEGTKSRKRPKRKRVM